MNLKKLINQIKNYFLVTLLFMFRTKISENKLKKMFCRLCELDYSEPMNFGWFEIQAYGNSVAISCFDGEKFVMNEARNGLRVSVPRGEMSLWDCVYETKECFNDVSWYFKFKLVYDTLYINHVFETREKENLDRSKKGIMT